MLSVQTTLKLHEAISSRAATHNTNLGNVRVCSCLNEPAPATGSEQAPLTRRLDVSCLVQNGREAKCLTSVEINRDPDIFLRTCWSKGQDRLYIRHVTKKMTASPDSSECVSRQLFAVC